MEERLENRRVIVRKVLILIGVLSLSIGLHSSGIAAIPGVACGWGHTVGLKSDGTVVAVGPDALGETNVGSWRGIIQVTAGELYTLWD